MVALAAGAAYLVISGSEVPAQRSYMMTATVLVAVLLDRPALTMRAVALAALIVLAAGAGEPDAAGVPDVLRGDDRAGRGLRGAARAGLVAA